MGLDIATKGKRRVEIVEDILSVLNSEQTYRGIKYRDADEKPIKQRLDQKLKDKLQDIHRELSSSDDDDFLMDKAHRSVNWEGNPNKTLNNFTFGGVQHRPDFEIRVYDINIAIEIKKGDSGRAVREGIGQSMVYTTNYDFVLYIFIDTSGDGKVDTGFEEETEQDFIESLWDEYNIKFSVL